MASPQKKPSKGAKSVNENKQSYVKTEFAIGAAIVCFIVGFFAARVIDGARPLASVQTGTGAAPVVQQRASGLIPQQSASNNTDWIESLEARTNENPESAVAWTQLGNAYFDTDQHLKAIDAYEKSLELAPDNPNVLTDMGIMYRRIDEPETAIRLFDQAMSVNPDHEMSAYNKGVVLLHDLRDTDGAVAIWGALAEKNPQFRSPTGQLLSDMVRSLK
jgi:cytochrome c-type biogenesis protein CcmH/NrfG